MTKLRWLSAQVSQPRHVLAVPIVLQVLLMLYIVFGL